MPESMTVSVHAKLNLSLDITGARPDGYHTLNTVMQSISLADTVTVERTDLNNSDSIGIAVSCGNHELDGDKNIAFLAAKKFLEHTGIHNHGVKIRIKKSIPLAAGLGGGSADAAAVIYIMNEIFHTELPTEELESIAAEVGMDVPFCISGGTQLAEGLGAILNPLPNIENCAFLLVKDGIKPSTAEMYKRFDSLCNPLHPNMEEIVGNICEGEIFTAAKMFDNSFAPLWNDNYESIKSILLESGAVNACLTGSGPTVFGIFESEDDARHAKSMLEETFDELYVCTPVNHSISEK